MRGLLSSVLCGILLVGCSSKSSSDEGGEEGVASAETTDADDGSASEGDDPDAPSDTAADGTDDDADGTDDDADGTETGTASGGGSGADSGADEGSGSGTDDGTGDDTGSESGEGSDDGSGTTAGTDDTTGDASGGGSSADGSTGSDAGSGADGSDGGAADSDEGSGSDGVSGSDGGSSGGSTTGTDGGSGADGGTTTGSGTDDGSGGGTSAGTDGGSGGGSSAGSGGGSGADEEDDEPIADPPPHGMAPVALCSVTPGEVEAGSETATWIGSPSYDPFGYELDYDWVLTEVPPGSLAEMPDGEGDRTGFLPDMPGEYVAELVVTNPRGLSSIACEARLTARPNADLQPVAVCSVAPNPVQAALETADWTGEASYDPYGLALTYEWTLIDTPEGAEALLPDGESDADPNRLDFLPDLAGTYTAQLVVTNSIGVESEPCFAELEAVSEQPVAICGVDPTVVATLTDDATWIGEGSYDPGGLALTYDWTLTEVPDGSTEPMPPGAENRTGFVPDVDGTYVAELVVTNEAGLSSLPCTATLEAVGDQPVAVCEVDPEFVHTGIDAADWLGEDSYDPSDLALTYSWTLVERPASSTAELPPGDENRLDFLADVDGTYVAELVVTNEAGVSSRPCIAKLEAVSDQPIAICEVTPETVGTRVETADWIGEDSYDPSGLALTYTWTLTEAPESSTALFPLGDENRLDFLPDVSGTYTAELVVTNAAGISSLPCTATLEAATVRPVAVCSVTPDSVHPLIESADWIGEESYDPSGLELTHSWRLVEQPDASAPVLPSSDENWLDFVPDVSGTYIAELVVTNSIGDASLPCRVELEAIGDQPEAVCSVTPETIAPRFESADWIGSESSDPSGLDLVEYHWTLITQPEGSTAELPDGDADLEGFMPDQPGEYVAQLVVTNEAGVSSLPCTATLTVVPDQPVAICEVDPISVRPIVDSADWIGHDSFDPVGSELTYIWTLTRKPDGSSAEMPPVVWPDDGADRLDFVPDMAGTYVAELVVMNEFGEASEPCVATLVAVPTDNLWVEVVWESPDDPEDAEDDMDLYLLAPGATLNDLDGDGVLDDVAADNICFWGNCRRGLEWGEGGLAEDNPFLDLDDFKDGPENIRIANPADGVFKVVVYDFNSSAAEYHDLSVVTVNIYLYGELTWTDTRDVCGEEKYVEFASIDTTATPYAVTAIADTPACP